MVKRFNPEFRVGQGGILEVSADRSLPGDAFLVLVDATAAPVTLTLLRADGFGGKRFCIKKVDSSVNAVIIVPIAGQTIDGQSSVELIAEEQSIDLISDNENYVTISEGTGPTVSAVKSFLLASSSATQISAVQTKINIDTLEASRGNNIIFNSGLNEFTLKAGKTYKLTGNPVIDDAGMDFQWFDITNAAQIGSIVAFASPTGFGNSGIIIAIISPIIDTVVAFRMGDLVAAGVLGFISGSRLLLPQVLIEEI